MEYTLAVIVVFVAVLSIYLSPIAKTTETFFSGVSQSGFAPNLLTLTFSQVTTWIFARSLMNAAILGFYYGIWGTLAYSTYYLSFITGGKIVDKIRFEQGYSSIQEFLNDHFGKLGVACYNFVIAIRLVSEVFANLLVFGVLFGSIGSNVYTFAIIGFSLITLFYSILGGLSASLKTDVLQMTLFIVTLSILLIVVLGSGQFSIADLNLNMPDVSQPGPILLMVALLQIWSYPMHDPVMMDRGFIADRVTTRKSFRYAAYIGVICIILFGSLGVLAGAYANEGDEMNAVLLRILGEWPMLVFSAALVISAMSTLDSALASAAKLVVKDMRLVTSNILNGRVVMSVFMLLGLLCLFYGNNDLFSAVAVSGTASMFLAPVVFFSVFADRKDIPIWSYMLAFFISIFGAILYFTESSSYTQYLGEIHKYKKLLYISICVLLVGVSAFIIGIFTNRKNSRKY